MEDCTVHGMNNLALPIGFTVDKSAIHGLGLFATEDLISVSTVATHIYHPILGWIRTALGAFINHSETPNCITTEDEVSLKTDVAIAAFNLSWVLLGTNDNLDRGPTLKVRYLLPRSPIYEGDEITLYYGDKQYHDL